MSFKKLHVLIVCKGNICRSPFAEIMLSEDRLAKSLANFKSRATEAYHVGKGAHKLGILVGGEWNYDLNGHIVKRVTKDDVVWSDIILVMDSGNADRLKEMFGNLLTSKRIYYLGNYLVKKRNEIPDPYKKPIAQFRKCFEMISSACHNFVKAELTNIKEPANIWPVNVYSREISRTSK